METQLEENGYQIIENIYDAGEIHDILSILENKDLEEKFGVREFLIDYPDIAEKIFNKNLINLIFSISPNCDQAIKSIYFDKPPNANWIVNWHQDLTINVTKRIEAENFKNWRTNSERTIVQPNVKILENIFTIRIHLDDCTLKNGALKIIEGSHKKGVIKIKHWIKNREGVERICEVKKGGVLVMKPLILHSSKRTENKKNRRVIHIEFYDQELPNGLKWKEKISLKEYMSTSISSTNT